MFDLHVPQIQSLSSKTLTEILDHCNLVLFHLSVKRNTEMVGTKTHAIPHVMSGDSKFNRYRFQELFSSRSSRACYEFYELMANVNTGIIVSHHRLKGNLILRLLPSTSLCTIIRTLRKSRRRRQRERHQTIGFKSKTMAVHVRYNFLVNFFAFLCKTAT